MNIIIAGDGKVGSMLTRQLSSEGHDITVIDSDATVLQSSVERYDVISVHGNCASMSVLQQAGVREADLLIAATNADEVNLLCCTTAHALNPKLHTIARIRNPEYTEQIHRMRNVFGLSMVINPEHQAAVEIDRLLKYPGFLRRDTFAKGRTEIVELRVDAGSKLCNVRLMDLRNIVKCQVLACAVLRGGSASAPKGDFVLREGDRVFFTALSQNLTTLLKNLGILTRRVRNVTICGGGRISYYLAKRLKKSGIAVRIIDNDYQRCVELCEMLPDVDVIHGDISEQDLLESEGLGQTDALVTLTGQDELNMIVSLYATSRGVPLVITKLGHTGNRSVIDSLSLGSVISPRELVCSNIVRYVRAMENQTGAAISVHTIAEGQAEAMEFLVEENTRYCGKPLKEIRLKPNILLVSIAHAGETEIPNGDSCFQKGDTVVVVDTNSQEIIRQLNDIFV
ncbi:MAG: Trk system potassium transporter TrkA [Oscillospiraceae bacterium]|nr:Trk system potassium transporter TrkA [Oscillospiraceae bacterium]